VIDGVWKNYPTFRSTEFYNAIGAERAVVDAKLQNLRAEIEAQGQTRVEVKDIQVQQLQLSKLQSFVTTLTTERQRLALLASAVVYLAPIFRDFRIEPAVLSLKPPIPLV
jgi:hypothetical protein